MKINDYIVQHKKLLYLLINVLFKKLSSIDNLIDCDIYTIYTTYKEIENEYNEYIDQKDKLLSFISQSIFTQKANKSNLNEIDCFLAKITQIEKLINLSIKQNNKYYLEFSQLVIKKIYD
jgi:hypothetical protein